MKPNLDDAKKAICTTTEGPVLVIAGPGSGKTMTLVERVVCLIEIGVESGNIMVATFTEKAAKELTTRISNRLLEEGIKANLNEMYIGTLHSLFLRILEEHHEYTRLKKNYRLLEPFEQTFYVYRSLSKFLALEGVTELLGGDNKKSYWSKAEEIVGRINVVNEELLDTKALLASHDVAIQAIARCHELYNSILDEENAIDFSAIQSETYNLFANHTNVLEIVQDKLKYVMVDEYQDTNTVQEKILLMMTAKTHNLCVVGDDDQGLYRFRGATIRNILEFDKNYAAGECKKFYLSTNYRSHPDIVNFYNNWMKEKDWEDGGITYRFEKNIVPDTRDFPKTGSVVKLSTENSETYHEEVLDFIRTMQESGKVTDLNQIAFLFRSVKGDKVVALSKFLEEHGIRVFSPRSELFFDRDEVKMVLGCLACLFPTLYDVIGEEGRMPALIQSWQDFFMSKVQKDAKANKYLILWVTGKMKAHAVLKENTDYAFTALVYEMLQFPLFAKYLDVNLTENKNDLRPAYNIGIILSLLAKFEYLYNITVFTQKNYDKTLKHFFGQYLRFIYDGGISEYEKFDENIPSGCVSFMTIHQSKGLEFPITIVGSMNGIPRKDYDEIDEILQRDFYHKPMFEPITKTKFYDFWRLYYTAFSRAQNVLVLTGCEKSGAGALPSKYLRTAWEKARSWRNADYFDISKLDLATVKSANIKHEYSFTSHILLYEACPLQYKFYKELEFTEVRTGAAIGGSLLHETIEDIHKAVLRGEENTLTNDNIEAWFNTNYHQLVKLNHSYIHEAQRNAILKQVLNYRDQNAEHWDEIKEAEVDVSLVKDDYILKGTIDLVKGVDGTVELVDFKSGDKPDVNTTDPEKRRILNQYHRQLEVYAHLIEERYGQKVSKMHLYYPKENDGNPRITFRYDAKDISHTIKSFEEVVRRIERHDYSNYGPHCSEKHCSDCDMRFYCNSK